MRIKISGVVNDSIVDGAGFRLTVFTQGCHHNCPGCHNPQTHDPEGGFWSDTEDILNVAAENRWRSHGTTCSLHCSCRRRT